MLMNLLFTALCLSLVLIVNLDVQSSRRVERVRASRNGRDSRPGLDGRD